MKHIRQIIGHQLINILHECNLADVQDDQHTVSTANDLNAKCACQHEAYGHIAHALTSIGFNRAVEAYTHEGDVDQAHAEIDLQYPGIEVEHITGRDVVDALKEIGGAA